MTENVFVKNEINPHCSVRSLPLCYYTHTHTTDPEHTQAGGYGQNKDFYATKKGGDLVKFMRLLYSTESMDRQRSKENKHFLTHTKKPRTLYKTNY